LKEINDILDLEPNFYEKFFYVDRIDSVIIEAIKPEIPGFSMLDNKGKDFADIYLGKEIVYLLFMHDLDEVKTKTMKSKELQNLISHCENSNIDLVGITNSPPIEIIDFINKYNVTFPIYYNPIDPVKGPFIVRDAIRSNPGLIILENGVVIKKKTWKNF
jgi:peroxiredoxin